MRVIRQVLFLSISLFLFGCANNGKHLYVDGKCISCWNNPLTQETLDYETAGANNYFKLEWHELMLEGLSQNNVRNLGVYGEDYLRFKKGLKTVSLSQNEIKYQREINKAAQDLRNALQKHRLKPAYQITVPSKLEKYDFSNQEFPLRLAGSFRLQSRNNINNLPRNIVVNVTNVEDLPYLKMAPSEAERFLKNRKNGRGLYVRYIVEILDMESASSFNGRIKEIQFINVKPSIVTVRDSEKHAPFQAIKIGS